MQRLSKQDLALGYDVKFMKETSSPVGLNSILKVIFIILIVVIIWWLGLEKAAQYTGSKKYF
jgi:hypothetical protein